MHYHLEVIMPPTDDVKAQLKNILAQFDENQGTDEDANPHSFWDFYVIGGRWAGAHLTASVDSEKLDQFYDELKKREITVSGLTCGKQEISPASQIPEVDALWREFFPDSELSTCPLFKHFNDQYVHNCLDTDLVGDLHAELTASRVIIAKPSYSDNSKFEANHMQSDSIWNGCNDEDTTWTGLVQDAIKDFTAKCKSYTEEARLKYLVRDDWLAVTVDYHS